MDDAARRRQFPLPVGLDRDTREPLSLERALEAPDALVTGEELEEDERTALVRARWEAGEWSDLLYCDQPVDLERATRELEERTELGRDLLRIGERAIEMALEDARAERSS